MSKVPSKVKAGDTLSATWLNEVVDCLKDHDEKLLRRRMLKGTGYTVRESAGGTSLTIETPPSKNPLPPSLDVKLNSDFQLRIKPKGQCEIDAETGSWDKVAQVHIGRVTNHADINIAVGASEGGSNVDASTAWDGGEWVDMGTLPALGEGGGGGEMNPILVFVKMTSEGNAPVAAEFIAVGSEEDLEQEEGVTYIPVGEVSCEMVEETPRYYIKQHQQGPIELSSTCPLAQYSGETGSDADSNVDSSVDSSVDISSVDRPGLIAAIRAETEEESRGASHWVITDGEVAVPLAHAPYQEEQPEGESNVDACRAGLILKLASASNIDTNGASDVDSATQWYIENGVLYHPEISKVETCIFGGEEGGEAHGAGRIGTIKSIGEGTQAGTWMILDGDIIVPPARDGQGGIINGAAWLTDGETPKVENGKVYFPKLPVVDIPLANYRNSNVDDNAGLICGIERRSDIDSDRIEEGVIRIPSGEYEFDPTYFVVDGRNVTINTTELDAIVAEAVDEIAVNIQVNGVLTHDEYGDLNYSTEATASLEELTNPGEDEYPLDSLIYRE